MTASGFHNMGGFCRGSQRLTCIVLLLACINFGQANAQTATPKDDSPSIAAQNSSEVLKKLDQLIEQNNELEKRNGELMDQIQALRQTLARQAAATPGASEKVPEPADITAVAKTPQQSNPSNGQEEQKEEQKRWGTYTPNLGFKVANTEHGDLSISIYSYARYLNQLALDSTFTNSFGITNPVVRRQEVQLQKLQIKFLGWVMSPKFRYFLYAWTSNPNQGQGAQVVLAGNLNYNFSKLFTLGAGIYSLPGTRSVEGNFPFWLGVDTRLIADEFFRPSYTSGIQARGDITSKLRYQAMLGNNLSTLGVSALQLDNGYNTFSSALVWTPTTGEFGQGFGDFEQHEKLATRLAGHFSRSHETKQSQPNSETFENTQIRLADGSIIFTPNLFGPGITIDEVRWRMAAVDGGLKYHGLSLEGEYFWRWLDNFGGPGTAGLPTLYDRGFQLQASAMAIPKTLQFYTGGSTVNGKFGNPYDFRMGLNWFPWQNRVVRWNTEGLYLNKSPVGYTSVPFSLGGTGWVFHSNLELAF
jgi:hypothetical protein